MLKLILYNWEAAISGLEFLPSIKEVRLSVKFYQYDIQRKKNIAEKEEAEKEARRMEDILKDGIRKQLASNKNGPALKMI